MSRLLCWMLKHRPAKFTTVDNVVMRDGWGNPLVRVRVCDRCYRPYLELDREAP